MDYNQIEQGLISSIAEDDPHKVSKQLQIKQWTHLYGRKLLRFSLSRTLNFVKQIISDEDCWYKVGSLEGVKLDRYEVGRKLLAATTPSGKDNPFNNMQKYKVACWCCFEDKIRELFTAKRANIDEDLTTEMLLESTYAGHGVLVTYWTHYITGYMDKFRAKLQLVGDNNDLHGFESAVRGKHSEALEYFWDKLAPVLSKEEKDDLLIYTATYDDFFVGRANSDMVTFAMDHLDKSKYHELLTKDVSKRGSCTTLYQLIDSYLFDRVIVLYRNLDLDFIDKDQYSTLMYLTLNRIVMIPNDKRFLSEGYNALSVLWNNIKFQSYKQQFIQELSYGSPTTGDVARLIKTDKNSDILSAIVSSLNIQQVQILQKSKSWAYEILKSANLFNDDVMKNLLAIEQTSVNILDKQEDMLVLGDSASIEHQELDSA